MALDGLTPRLRQGIYALALLLGCSAPGLALTAQLPHLSDEAEQKAGMKDPQKGRERLLAYVKPGAPAAPRDQMIAFTNIAISHMAQRNYNKILEAAQSGFFIAQRLGDKHFMALNLSYMGIANDVLP